MGLEEMKGFYTLKCAPTFMRIELSDDIEFEQDVEQSLLHARGEIPAKSNLRFRPSHGKPGDYLDNLAPYCYGLCSPKLQAAIQQYDLKGSMFMPAKLITHKDCLELGALIVRGRAEIMHGQHMKKIRRPVARSPEPHTADRKTEEENYCIGLYFDPGTWDGSDFFTDTKLTSRLMCTQRVVDMVHEFGLTGCAFWPLDEYDWGVPDPFFLDRRSGEQR